jgi:hypothetical protein
MNDALETPMVVWINVDVHGKHRKLFIPFILMLFLATIHSLNIV